MVSSLMMFKMTPATTPRNAITTPGHDERTAPRGQRVCVYVCVCACVCCVCVNGVAVAVVPSRASLLRLYLSNMFAMANSAITQRKAMEYTPVSVVMSPLTWEGALHVREGNADVDWGDGGDDGDGDVGKRHHTHDEVERGRGDEEDADEEVVGVRGGVFHQQKRRQAPVQRLHRSLSPAPTHTHATPSRSPCAS